MTSDAASEPRILPGLSALNRPYWTGGADGRLMIARCGNCGFYLHPPMPACRRCGSDDVGPQPVSGRGRIASFTINRQAWMPGMTVPFVFVAVELAEQAGLHVLSNLEGCAPDAVTAGMPVEVFFRAVDDVHLPFFRPVAS